MLEKTFVELNPDVGCHILTFLEGIDAINFLEAVNSDQQFWRIAKTLDRHFIELIEMFCGHQRISFSQDTLPFNFTDEHEIVDGRLISVANRYSDIKLPLQRLYVHPCFSVEGFIRLCEVYRTPLFKCYSRLLPLNTVFYYADFGLLNYEWYAHTIGSERTLNDHEKKLFQASPYFNTKSTRDFHSNIKFVRTVEEFKQNLEARFASDAWLEAIDFSKWAIIGGSVLNALCHTSFLDTKQQEVDLVYYMCDIFEFKKSIDDIVNSLNIIAYKDSKKKIRVEKNLGTPDYNVLLPCHIRLNFIWTPLGKSKSPLSYILHNFDMDICQVAFTGNKIVSTFPFLQALATRSFIVYTLHAQSPKHLCTRIAKYCSRGFTFLEPIGFDGDFDLLLAQEEIPLYRAEHQQYIDNDGEIRILTKEFRRPFSDNVDTFQLQEKFMSIVCPQLLLDK